MTHEQIVAAIERLKALPEKHIYTCTDVVNAICSHGWVDTLIELLEQADPDTHMELPVDADGVPIHVGDELCGHHYPDGGMYCRSIGGSEIIFVNKVGEHYKDAMMWRPSDCRHYHKLTVEDVLGEFVARWHETHHDDIPELLANYAAKLREVIDGD